MLCYHSVSNQEWRFDVTIDMFEKQIDYLKRKFKFITAKTFLDYLKGKKNIEHSSVLLTFDDGYRDILRVKKLLKINNIKPLLFILTSQKRVNRKELNNNKQLLTFTQIKDLKNNGWDIGSHSLTHCNLLKIDSTRLKEELEGSKRLIEKKLNVKIVFFSYPRGKYNNLISEKVFRAGYKLAFTMDDDFINPNINPYSIPRIGIDKSHNFIVFKATISPSVILFRKIVKKTFLHNYL